MSEERALHVLIPAELLRQLRIRAAEWDMTQKELVIHALEQYLDDAEQVRRAARKTLRRAVEREQEEGGTEK